MEPITTTPKPEQSQADPVETIKVGDEIYELVYDYNVGKVIARLTGINPLLQGIWNVLNHPEGLEISLWAMLTQMGKRNRESLPSAQLQIKMEEVQEWFMEGDYEWQFATLQATFRAFERNSPRPKKTDTPKVEGENSSPPAGTVN